jgi:hypothetical protein
MFTLYENNQIYCAVRSNEHGPSGADHYHTNRMDASPALTISEIIANEVMDFDTLTVTIFPLPPNTTIQGAVSKHKEKPHTYTLHLNQSLSIKTLIETIAHEFVHIKQYEHEGLEIFGDIWVWNPDGLEDEQDVTWGSMTFTGYEVRGFELDAYERQVGIAKKTLRILKDTDQLAMIKKLI